MISELAFPWSYGFGARRVVMEGESWGMDICRIGRIEEEG